MGGEEHRRNDGWPFALEHVEQCAAWNCRNTSVACDGPGHSALSMPAGEGNNHVVDKVYCGEGRSVSQEVYYDQFLRTKEDHQC
jgi:hypothetical protein